MKNTKQLLRTEGKKSPQRKRGEKYEKFIRPFQEEEKGKKGPSSHELKTVDFILYPINIDSKMILTILNRKQTLMDMSFGDLKL